MVLWFCGEESNPGIEPETYSTTGYYKHLKSTTDAVYLEQGPFSM